MSELVNNLISDAAIITDGMRKEFGNLSSGQLNWKPSAEVWSIGQCIDHLITTNELYFESFEPVANGTHINNWFSVIPFAPKLTGAIMKKILGPESPKRMRTFRIFEPSLSDVSERVVEDFAKTQAKFSSIMTASKDLDLNRIKIPEPISVAVNVSLSDAFEILVVHEKRHFNQAKRLLNSENFPT